MTPKARVARDCLVVSPEDRRTVILDVIRSATRQISLSLFRCNDKEIFKELKRARERGVGVNALVTARADGGEKKLEKLRRKLQDAGVSITVYADPVVKYHAKYLVADDGPAIVASLNFTKKCFSRTLDGLVITWDPAVVAGLRALLDADRELRPTPAGLPDRLVVGPERARAQMMALLQSASSSIRLLDAKLSDPAFVALLAKRRAEGIRVETFDRKKYGELKSHGKICLIDDTRVVVGGLALASLSLDFRREVALVSDEPELIADAKAFFESLRPLAAAATA